MNTRDEQETNEIVTYKSYDYLANELYKVAEVCNFGEVDKNRLVDYLEQLADTIVEATIEDTVQKGISTGELNKLVILRKELVDNQQAMRQIRRSQIKEIKDQAFEEGYQECLKTNKKKGSKKLLSILVDE